MRRTPYPQPRIVIIGLGVVGAALADELVLRGMRRITVVDQGPRFVTGGSSSHAPGFVFQTGPSRVMSQLAQRTLDKFDGATLDGATVDGGTAGGSWVSKRVGGLEIARTPERLTELSRRAGFADAWGVPATLVSPQECAELFPLLDPATVLGGLHTPTDAVVKGVRAVQWQAQRAIAGGAVVRELTRVTGIRTRGGRVSGVEVVPVPRGDAEPEVIGADIVISCAGLWGPGMAREMLGFELPMMPMEHGFGWSTPLPSLAGISEQSEVERPMLRHQDAALYLREWGPTISLGAYEHTPIPVEPDAIASADDFAATGVHPAIHPFTPGDYEASWSEARAILPELRATSLDTARTFNGIFSFTPDGGPMLGPVPGTEGLWLAQAVWVTQSAGIGQVMADWIVDGDPGIDTHGLDFRRFDPAIVSHEWTVQRASEAYDEVYDIVHPRASTERLRGLRTPGFHDRQRALGAVFAEASGWERPLWYESNADLPRPELARRDEWSARHWSPIAAGEAQALRERVGLVDMTALMRLEVTGPGATSYLRSMLTSDVDTSVGGIVYGLLLSDRGGVRSDVTVARLGPERYHLGVNGPLDLAWLTGHLPPDSGIQIRDVSQGQCGLGLWGPKARDVLSALTDHDLSNEAFGFYKAREIRVAGIPVLAMRLSYVGELGWELYTAAGFAGRLWDALWDKGAEHGMAAVGRRAFESLRLEKGYRLWGHDVTETDTPEEAGIGFAVRGAGREFRGRSALGAPPRRLLTCLTLDDPARVVMGHEPVRRVTPGDAGPVIGYVTSADQGYTTGTSIAYAWLPPDVSEVGTAVSIDYFGEPLRATVTAEPIHDPQMKRMRC